MKKLFILLFAIIIAVPAFAQLKSDQVVGNWKYSVVTDSNDITGILKITEKEGKLTGEVLTSNGNKIPLTKVEIKTENQLYIELKTESDVIKVSVKVEEKKFKGTVASYQGETQITAVKQE